MPYFTLDSLVYTDKGYLSLLDLMLFLGNKQEFFSYLDESFYSFYSVFSLSYFNNVSNKYYLIKDGLDCISLFNGESFAPLSSFTYNGIKEVYKVSMYDDYFYYLKPDQLIKVSVSNPAHMKLLKALLAFIGYDILEVEKRCLATKNEILLSIDELLLINYYSSPVYGEGIPAAILHKFKDDKSGNFSRLIHEGFNNSLSFCYFDEVSFKDNKPIRLFKDSVLKSYPKQFVLRLIGMYLVSGYRYKSLIRLKFSKDVCKQFPGLLSYFIDFFEKQGIYYKRIYRASSIYVDVDVSFMSAIDYIFPFDHFGLRSKSIEESVESFSFINFLNKEEWKYLLEGIFMAFFGRFGFVKDLFIMPFKKSYYSSLFRDLYLFLKLRGANIYLKSSKVFDYLILKDFKSSLLSIFGFNIDSFVKEFTEDYKFEVLYYKDKSKTYSLSAPYFKESFGSDTTRVFDKFPKNIDRDEFLKVGNLKLDSLAKVPLFSVCSEDSDSILNCGSYFFSD